MRNTEFKGKNLMIPTMNQVSESIIVWRYFAALGSGTVDSELYQQILQENAEYLWAVKAVWVMQQNNGWGGKNHILEWQRQNPDLSSTEMLWHDLKTVQTRQTQNVSWSCSLETNCQIICRNDQQNTWLKLLLLKGMLLVTKFKASKKDSKMYNMWHSTLFT